MAYVTAVSTGREYDNGKSRRKVLDIEIPMELPVRSRQRRIVYVKNGETVIRSCSESAFLRWVNRGGIA